MKRDGLEDRRIVAVLADHGENLLDAGGPLAHGEAIERDGSTSVPWLLSWPGQLTPSVVHDPVSTLDLMPTILDLIGVAGPTPSDGRSLAAVARRGPAPEARPVLFETGIWYFSRETVNRADPSGLALAYADFTHGLLAIERGSRPHIVVAPEHRDAVVRAKHRRIESGGVVGFPGWGLAARSGGRPAGCAARLEPARRAGGG